MNSLAPSQALQRASTVRAAGSWHGDARDCVVLDYDDRHRRRMRMQGVRGIVFLLDLAEAVALRGGDALVLDDGGLVEVVAAPEHLVEISSTSSADMVRIAWHLGNRHLPVALSGAKLTIRRDHVIEAMIERLGGRLQPIEGPFYPEGGAYAEMAGHAHGHHHAHDHGAPHDHGRAHHGVDHNGGDHEDDDHDGVDDADRVHA